MTDAEWLTLVLVVVYLIECLSIVPSQAVLISSRGPHRGCQLKPLAVLPGINRGILFSNPLNLLAKEYLIVDSHVVIARDHLLVVDNLGGRFHKITIMPARSGARNDRAPNDLLGRLLVTDDWIQAQLQEIDRLSTAEDSLHALRLTHNSVRRIRRLKALAKGRLALLANWTAFQALVVLILFPVLMIWRGVLPALWIVAPIVVAAQLLICFELLRLRRRYLRESTLIAIVQLVPVFLFPIGAVRSAVGFARRLPQGFNPALAKYALVDAERSLPELARYGRWLVYAFAAVCSEQEMTECDLRAVQEWRRSQIGDLDQFLRSHDRTLRILLQESHPEQGDEKFCPLCLAEYEPRFSRCSECGNIALKNTRSRVR